SQNERARIEAYNRSGQLKACRPRKDQTVQSRTSWRIGRRFQKLDYLTMTNLEATCRRQCLIKAGIDDRLTMVGLRAIWAEFSHYAKMRRLADVVDYIKSLDLVFQP